MDDNQFWLRLWVLAIVGVCSLIIILREQSRRETETMLKAGYTWTQVSSGTRGAWVQTKGVTKDE